MKMLKYFCCYLLLQQGWCAEIDPGSLEWSEPGDYYRTWSLIGPVNREVVAIQSLSLPNSNPIPDSRCLQAPHWPDKHESSLVYFCSFDTEVENLYTLSRGKTGSGRVIVSIDPLIMESVKCSDSGFKHKVSTLTGSCLSTSSPGKVIYASLQGRLSDDLDLTLTRDDKEKEFTSFDEVVKHKVNTTGLCMAVAKEAFISCPAKYSNTTSERRCEVRAEQTEFGTVKILVEVEEPTTIDITSEAAMIRDECSSFCEYDAGKTKTVRVACGYYVFKNLMLQKNFIADCPMFGSHNSALRMVGISICMSTNHPYVLWVFIIIFTCGIPILVILSLFGVKIPYLLPKRFYGSDTLKSVCATCEYCLEPLTRTYLGHRMCTTGNCQYCGFKVGMSLKVHVASCTKRKEVLGTHQVPTAPSEEDLENGFFRRNFLIRSKPISIKRGTVVYWASACVITFLLLSLLNAVEGAESSEEKDNNPKSSTIKSSGSLEELFRAGVITTERTTTSTSTSTIRSTTTSSKLRREQAKVNKIQRLLNDGYSDSFRPSCPTQRQKIQY